MPQATIFAKNQLVIPREAREALGLKVGDKLLVGVRGNSNIVLQKPKAHHVAIRGLAGKPSLRGYLQKERRRWD